MESSKEINNKDPKFKFGDTVRISKYKSIFAKGYTPNWSEEAFVIKKAKNTLSWIYITSDLNGEEIVGTFYEKKKLQKTNKKNGKVTIICFIVGSINKWVNIFQNRNI